MTERANAITISTRNRQLLSSWDAGPGRSRRIHFGLPTHTAPAACATIVLGIGLATAGTVSTNSTGSQMLPLSGFKPGAVAPSVLERRRRYATAAQALLEVRLWAGLAWGTIADMLEVSRRTVHQWASGVEPTGSRADALWDLHKLAADKAPLGQTAAAALLTSHYRVEHRALRASPRRSTPNAGAILVADNSPLKHVPGSRGVRNLRKSKDA